MTRVFSFDIFIDETKIRFPGLGLCIGKFNLNWFVSDINVNANGLVCRFHTTEECYAHPLYKRKLVELDEIECTIVFGKARWSGALIRVLHCRHLFSRTIDPFQPMKVKPASLSMAIHQFMACYSFGLIILCYTI